MGRLNFLEHADKLWILIKRIEEDKDTNIQELKEIFRPDIILRKHGFLYLCDEVPELKYEDADDSNNT